ncbi:MAG: hypothetical protein M0R37_10060 [Bacteroidales bacterium]|nr:hypothetical protein [Bacteroidales bacterium]
MKKILTIISVLMVLGLTSCETNKIEYLATDLDQSKFAEIKLVYDLPLVTSTSQNSTRLLYNGDTVSMVSTALGSVYPNSASKYHVLPIGSNTVQMLKSTLEVIYENTFSISAGKWFAFVYNTAQPPVMIQEPETYTTGDPWADTITHIRFVNLFHKADGTPYGKLYLKGKRTINGVLTYVDIASANFGEAADYVDYRLYRGTSKVWSGSESSLIFVLFDEFGNQLGYYKNTSATTKTPYEATGYSLAKGVNYIFHLNGKEGTNYATQAIRLSTIQSK